MTRVEPLISIALCTYNGERFLAEQIESLLEQTYKNVEIVVVDDCSMDGTMALLDRFAQSDARLRVERNAANLGFSRNFAKAMQLCRGEFVAPCDQDDIWLPDKLHKLWATIGDQPLVFSDSEYIDEHGRKLGIKLSDRMNMMSTNEPLNFLFWNFVPGHTMLFRRDLLMRALPIPDSFAYYDWWLAAVAATERGIVFCDECLTRYRQHGGNATTSLWQEGAKEQQARGYKLRELRAIGARLASLASLENHRPLMASLDRLWRAREEQWICPKLAFLTMSYRREIYAPRNIVGWRRLRRSLRFIWGIKLKRLINKQAYSPT